MSGYGRNVDNLDLRLKMEKCRQFGFGVENGEIETAIETTSSKRLQKPRCDF